MDPGKLQWRAGEGGLQPGKPCLIGLLPPQQTPTPPKKIKKSHRHRRRREHLTYFKSPIHCFAPGSSLAYKINKNLQCLISSRTCLWPNAGLLSNRGIRRRKILSVDILHVRPDDSYPCPTFRATTGIISSHISMQNVHMWPINCITESVEAQTIIIVITVKIIIIALTQISRQSNCLIHLKRYHDDVTSPQPTGQLSPG